METQQALSNGLERALATLTEGQAQFAAEMAETNNRITELEKTIQELEKNLDRRFRRIEELLLRQDQMLQGLPETIRQKIRFEQPR